VDNQGWRKIRPADDALREVIGPQLDQSAAMCADVHILGFIGRKRKLFSHNDVPVESVETGSDSMISGSLKFGWMADLGANQTVELRHGLWSIARMSAYGRLC
jgi:hypothetical protein